MDVKRVIVSPGELKNGWDDASLREYLNDRNEVQADKINPRSEARRKRPDVQNSKYKPQRWRA